MSKLQFEMKTAHAALHIFMQDGGWHWGITVPRENGCGFRVIAFNERSFARQIDAESDGSRALGQINRGSGAEPGTTHELPSATIAEHRRG